MNTPGRAKFSNRAKSRVVVPWRGEQFQNSLKFSYCHWLSMNFIFLFFDQKYSLYLKKSEAIGYL